MTRLAASLLYLLASLPAMAQIDDPGGSFAFSTVASLYAAVDEGAARADFAALTPASAVAGEWTAAVQGATVLDRAMQGLTDTTPVPGLSVDARRAERRAGLSTLAALSAATGAAISTVTPFRLALTAPDHRAAAYAAYGRDADALALLLSELGYVAAAVAVASDAEVDATLAAIAPQAALVHEVVGRLRAATASPDGP